jgi:TRAP transporter TAXI family solute receptor
MRIALAFGLCLIAATAFAGPRVKDLPKPDPDVTAAAQGTRDKLRAQMNENVVTIMAGSPSGTDLAIVQDIASVLDDGDKLRVLPMVGKGPEQNIKDVLFLRGVDMGVTQANLLKHFDKTGELGPNLRSQIAYIAKLFNEELHLLVRDDVNDIKELNGKAVNFGRLGSGAEITGRLIFQALGVETQQLHLNDADAIQKLKAGEIDATIIVTGKPAPVLTTLKEATGLKLLPVPYAMGVEDEYYPATLTHDDYPNLVRAGESVETVSVCAVLISFNWPGDSVRYAKIAKFVDRFFANFDRFLEAPRHPKWREVNFAATLENWRRSPLSQAWIDRVKRASGDTASRGHFDAFIAQASGRESISEAERAELFRAFLQWSKARSQN